MCEQKLYSVSVVSAPAKTYPVQCEHSLILKRVVLSLYFCSREEEEVYYKLQSIPKERSISKNS